MVVALIYNYKGFILLICIFIDDVYLKFKVLSKKITILIIIFISYIIQFVHYIFIDKGTMQTNYIEQKKIFT